MNNFLMMFFVLSIINVIFSTARTIITIKGSKATASLVSGGYFAFYNLMLVYTVADFPMWQKCLITFVCNVIGVYVVKWAEEKARKDKVWKIEITASPSVAEKLNKELTQRSIPHNYVDVKKYVIFNLYCATQKESIFAKELCDKYAVKYFVSETKDL